MAPSFEVSIRVASTWIKHILVLLGMLKTIEIGMAFIDNYNVNHNKRLSEKNSEKGFLYQRLSNVEETKSSHGPSDSLIRKRKLLEPLVVPHLLGFSQAIIPAGSSVERHVHLSKYETFFCKEGQGFINIGATKEPSNEDKALELMPGSCVTIMPKYYHSVHNNGTTDLTLLYFGVEQ